MLLFCLQHLKELLRLAKFKEFLIVWYHKNQAIHQIILMSDSSNKIFLMKDQSKDLETFLHLFSCVSSCSFCSTDIVPHVLHVQMIEEYFQAWSAVKHCLTISFFFFYLQGNCTKLYKRMVIEGTISKALVCLRRCFNKLMSWKYSEVLSQLQ